MELSLLENRRLLQILQKTPSAPDILSIKTSTMERVFDRLSLCSNLFDYELMAEQYRRSGEHEKIRQLIDRLLQQGSEPSSNLWALWLRTVARSNSEKLLANVHEIRSKQKTEMDTIINRKTYAILIGDLVNVDYQMAERLFEISREDFPTPSLRTWCTMITESYAAGHPESTYIFFKEMLPQKFYRGEELVSQSHLLYATALGIKVSAERKDVDTCLEAFYKLANGSKDDLVSAKLVAPEVGMLKQVLAALVRSQRQQDLLNIWTAATESIQLIPDSRCFELMFLGLRKCKADRDIVWPLFSQFLKTGFDLTERSLFDVFGSLLRFKGSLDALVWFPRYLDLLSSAARCKITIQPVITKELAAVLSESSDEGFELVLSFISMHTNGIPPELIEGLLVRCKDSDRIFSILNSIPQPSRRRFLIHALSQSNSCQVIKEIRKRYNIEFSEIEIGSIIFSIWTDSSPDAFIECIDALDVQPSPYRSLSNKQLFMEIFDEAVSSERVSDLYYLRGWYPSLEREHIERLHQEASHQKTFRDWFKSVFNS